MILTLFTVLYLIGMHWVADFLFQSTKMATNKNDKNTALLAHTLLYSFIMTLSLISFSADFNVFSLSLFFGITFCCHTIQDRITSRLTKKQFAIGNFNGVTGAFTIIGFDQLLHYIQIFLTFCLLYGL